MPDKDAKCGNCGKPYHEHYFEKYLDEDRVYCFTNTNGDVFEDEPSDMLLVAFIEENEPELYERLVRDWKEKYGHTKDC